MIESQKAEVAQTIAWVGVTSFSALIYGAVLAVAAPGQLLAMLGLGLLFFFIGFVLGPLAFLFCVAALGVQLKEWIALSLRWISCCPGGGSDGGIGLLLLGSVFVGGSYSTYLLVQRVRKKPARTSHVFVGSALLAAVWIAVVWHVAELCGARGCVSG